MARRINYDDDIFFLELRLRHVRQSAKLDLNDYPYLGRLLDDLRFIDSGIRSLQASLVEARQLTARGEHLSQLASLAAKSARFLDELRYDTSPLAQRIDREGGDLVRLGEAHAGLAESMRAEAAGAGDSASDEQQVSPEEMQHLLLDEADGA